MLFRTQGVEEIRYNVKLVEYTGGREVRKSLTFIKTGLTKNVGAFLVSPKEFNLKAGDPFIWPVMHSIYNTADQGDCHNPVGHIDQHILE